MTSDSETATTAAPIDLQRYGLEVDTLIPADFFGHEPSAELGELEGFLNWKLSDDVSELDALSCRLAGDLEDALYCIDSGGVYAGCYFLLQLFPALGFVPRGVMVGPRQATLTAEKKTTRIRMDMTLRLPRRPGSVLLVAKEDESTVGGPDPEALLVASAIAAFQETQVGREKMSLPPVDYVEYPGLVMDGTRPTFYKISVSAALSAAVAEGRPAELRQPTRITKCVVPSQGREQNMADLAYRRRAVQYMDAFREFTFDLWRKFHGIAHIVPPGT